MEGRKHAFFDEEAAVDALAKGCFCDKVLMDKVLFEIGEGLKKALKRG
jgi:hypothetical protein